jgi:AbrB family looped-hinge helix DNA binding protein
MRTTVSTKGQIVLPAEIRERDDIRPGEVFEIESIDRGQYKLTRVEGRRNRGLVRLLLDCPVRGWFKPVERNDMTDGIQPPQFG